jgi:hypothetical protein
MHHFMNVARSLVNKDILQCPHQYLKISAP